MKRLKNYPLSLFPLNTFIYVMLIKLNPYGPYEGRDEGENGKKRAKILRYY